MKRILWGEGGAALSWRREVVSLEISSSSQADSLLRRGGRGGTRTHNPFKGTDFKSAM